MKNFYLVVATVISLALFSGSCNRNGNDEAVRLKEFSFQGGTFKDGKIIVNPDVKAEQDPKTKKISLRMAGGGLGAEIDCTCSSGSGGSCFPVSQDAPGGGPIIVLCASIDPCSDCSQVITVPGSFTFSAMCRGTALAKSQ